MAHQLFVKITRMTCPWEDNLTSFVAKTSNLIISQMVHFWASHTQWHSFRIFQELSEYVWFASIRLTKLKLWLAKIVYYGHLETFQQSSNFMNK